MYIDLSNIGSCVLKLCTLDSCENEIYTYMCIGISSRMLQRRACIVSSEIVWQVAGFESERKC